MPEDYTIPYYRTMAEKEDKKTTLYLLYTYMYMYV